MNILAWLEKKIASYFSLNYSTSDPCPIIQNTIQDSNRNFSRDVTLQSIDCVKERNLKLYIPENIMNEELRLK